MEIENGRVMLNEDFSNNSNNWFGGQKEVTAMSFENGVYTIENKENRRFTPSTFKVYIIPNSDFLIELIGRQLNGFGYSIGVG